MTHRLSAISVLLLMMTGCDASTRPPAPSLRFRLVEKGPYQILYGSDGRLERILYDGNGDRKADLMTIYAPNGKPARAEIDTDQDGIVDRWEYFDREGVLNKIGASHRKSGTPDEWIYAGTSGQILRKERDEDGDGGLDEWQFFENGVLAVEEFDTDGDGKPDRRLVRDADGDPIRAETDADGDGVWERTVDVRREP